MPSSTPNPAWDDQDLAAACLAGNPEGWTALIGKYKGMIYSIPLRYGLSREDAADVFQDVCLRLYEHLGTVRDAGALRGWLASVASHESYRKKTLAARAAGVDVPDLPDPSTSAPEWLAESERRQTIREGMSQLPARCRELLHLLFYEDPPRPYQEVARTLGLAIGSIGFIRGRCLSKLERLLEAADL